MTKYYVSYGSNLNKDDMLLMRCRKAQPVGTAVLEKYRLEFHGITYGSYLTIIPDENSSVVAGVWRVTEDDEDMLDYYEGYPQLYYKKNIPVLTVLTPEGETLTVRNAFVYIMNDEYSTINPPSSAYFNACLEGFRDFGIPEKALLDAALKAAEISGKPLILPCTITPKDIAVE